MPINKKKSLSGKEKYRAIKESGVCWSCRKNAVVPGQTRCAECADLNRRKQNERYRIRAGKKKGEKLKLGRPTKNPFEIISGAVKKGTSCTLSAANAKIALSELRELRRLRKLHEPE